MLPLFSRIPAYFSKAISDPLSPQAEPSVAWLPAVFHCFDFRPMWLLFPKPLHRTVQEAIWPAARRLSRTSEVKVCLPYSGYDILCYINIKRYFHPERKIMLKHSGTHEIETERLLLRHFSPEDIQDYFAWTGDPEVSKHWKKRKRPWSN